MSNGKLHSRVPFKHSRWKRNGSTDDLRGVREGIILTLGSPRFKRPQKSVFMWYLKRRNLYWEKANVGSVRKSPSTYQALSTCRKRCRLSKSRHMKLIFIETLILTLGAIIRSLLGWPRRETEWANEIQIYVSGSKTNDRGYYGTSSLTRKPRQGSLDAISHDQR